MDHHPPGVAHPTEKTPCLAFTHESPTQRPCLASTPDKTLSSPPEPAEGHKGGPEVSGCSPTPTAFSLNQNHVVCLPLVSNDLKLLWACSEETQELEGTAKLVEAFNVFPYPTLTKTALLAQSCSLHPDQVRVWFMVQRLRFGISWDCKEIREARSKLCTPLHMTQSVEGKGKEAEREVAKEKMLEVRVVLTREDVNNKHKLSPVSTQFSLSSKSSPVPRKRRKCQPTATSLQQHRHDKPGPQKPQSIVAPPSGLNRPNNPRASHSELWRCFMRNKKPSESELHQLQRETGLNMKYIRKWFCNRRSKFTADKQTAKTHNSGILQVSSFEGKAETEPEAQMKEGNQETTIVSECGGSVSLKDEGEKLEVDRRHSFTNHNKEIGDNPCISPGHASKLGPRPKKTIAQLELLRQSFLTCQWPTREDYTRLQSLTGLTRHAIIQWFGDTRYHVKHGFEQWMRKEERCKVLAEIKQKQQGKLLKSTRSHPRPPCHREADGEEGGGELKFERDVMMK